MKRKEMTWILVCFALLFFAAYAFAVPVPVIVPVPNTGQTRCYSVGGSEITCPSPGQALYGQNANYATINEMSYTKLDGNGVALSDPASPWVMVRDNVTGLTWELKTKMDGVKDYSNPHDADNTYTWYDSNPATNGGYAGTPGSGTDTEDFINALNDELYGGKNDWRLPTVKELTYIVNYGIPYPGPTINPDFFPNTQQSFYWSSISHANYKIYAWGVPFDYGYDGYYNFNKDHNYYVRAVRGGQPGPLYTEYSDNGDGTVTDKFTDLMWQQAGSSSNLTWEQSLAYCENLNLGGYTDWRLPTIKELRSLVDFSRYSPSINTTFFPNTQTFYCSSTTYTKDTYSAWGVYFNDGYDGYSFKVNGGYVRAVRGGQTKSAAGSLVAGFASLGLWVYNPDKATWTQIKSVCPENMIYSGSTLYAGFGVSGLWKWDGLAWSWSQLTSDIPESMMPSGSTLYVDFGVLGIRKWDGLAWSQLTSVNPENMVTSGSTLYADFGASRGLWKWDGLAWSQLTSVNPENMVTSGSTLYASFASSGASGICKWDGAAWSQLTSVNPENMVTSDSTLYADFGASHGLWKWDGAAWSQLTSANPENMVTSGSTLYANFAIDGASGIWKWDGVAWSQLTSRNPENMAPSGSTLYVNFGKDYGLWKWYGSSWSRLTELDPVIMAVPIS
jgi:Protein of unknown function (DUF1566)